MILYAGRGPLTTRSMNRFEMMNEIVVCYCTLNLAFFSDWILKPETKVMFGW